MTGLEMDKPLQGWPPGIKLLCVETGAEHMYKAGEVYTTATGHRGCNALIDYKGKPVDRNGHSARWEVLEDRPVNLEELM